MNKQSTECKGLLITVVFVTLLNVVKHHKKSKKSEKQHTFKKIFFSSLFQQTNINCLMTAVNVAVTFSELSQTTLQQNGRTKLVRFKKVSLLFVC